MCEECTDVLRFEDYYIQDHEDDTGQKIYHYLHLGSLRSQCGRRQRAIGMYWHQREVRYDEIKDEITMENLAQSTRRAPRLRNQAQHHAPKLSTVQKISTLVGEEEGI